MSISPELIKNLSPEERRALLQQLLAEENAQSVFPQSFSQQRLWLLDQLEPGEPTYNMTARYRMTGKLDEELLDASLQKLIQRQASLRTCFGQEKGQPVQYVAAEVPFTLKKVDISHLGETEKAAELERLAGIVFREAFNLAKPPLLRGTLVRLEAEEYELLFCMHHIIGDGWSTGIFHRELAEFYRAAKLGETPNLPELTYTYAEHARQQIEWSQSPDFARHLKFWQEHLAEANTVLDLPTDRPRPPKLGSEGARMEFRWSQELLHQLKALARETRTTLYMTLLTAFKVLLYKYTGQANLVVGSPVAGRTSEEVEPLLGFFLNTLVLHTKLDPEMTFREALAAVRASTLAAFEHQKMPVEKIIDSLDIERDFSRNALFQTLFVLQNAPRTKFHLPDLQSEGRVGDTQTAKLDLSLYMTEEEYGFVNYAEYSTLLFDAATIHRLLDHFRLVVETMLAQPDLPIRAVSLLTPAERAQILGEWRGYARGYPLDEDLIARFERLAADQPGAPAFHLGGETLDYAALNAHANRLARRLAQKGLQPGEVVGVLAPRSFEAAAAVLSIWKAGGVYLPLDPEYPAARLAYMLADSAARFLITANQALTDRLETPASAQVIRLDDPQTLGGMPSPGADNPAGARTPETPAYMLYTSGSTGKPKGVRHPFRQITNRLYWMWEAMPFEAGEVGAHRTALNFIDSIWELFGPLLQGLPTVIIPNPPLEDPNAFLGALAQHRVRRLWVVPSLVRALLDLYPDLAARLPDLKHWIASGEALDIELFRRFEREMPHATLYNLYGTSEVWDATCYTPDGGTAALSRVPIGKPLANVDVYVLDAQLNPVPVGVPGVLYVGGPGLGLGYHNQPEQTAQAFIESPFAPGERLNRTGDLARWLPDGNLDYLGRADQQVKLRGHRMEPGEVETLLLQQPGVRNAIVSVHEEQLVAYLLARETPPDIAALRAALRAQLPAVMVPSEFILLDEFPMTPSGKIKRNALPVPGGQAQTRKTAHQAARTPAESMLTEIWADLLKNPNLGIHDDFFDLGGHSLLAIQLVGRIENALGVRLPLTSLFEASTISQQALLLGEAAPQAAGKDTSYLVALQNGKNGTPPLFFVHGFGGGVTGYAHLARKLGAHQPFYGLQAGGFDNEQPPHTTIPEMAEAYLSDVRAVQPRGPYYLGGYCYGGLVAFEMARRLQEQGEQVAHLALVESFAPMRRDGRETVFQNPRMIIYFFKNLPFWFQDFMQLGWGGMKSRVKVIYRRTKKSVLRKLGKRQPLNARDFIEDDVDLLTERHRELMEIQIRALLQFPRARYNGAAHLYRVRGGSLSQTSDQRYGWEELITGGIDIHFVQGAHRTLLNPPHVESLADEIRKQLGKQ